MSCFLPKPSDNLSEQSSFNSETHYLVGNNSNEFIHYTKLIRDDIECQMVQSKGLKSLSIVTKY